jgi:hypothetical protein
MLGTLIGYFFQYNEVEGVRLRAGGRTYFGTDDLAITGVYGVWF